MMMKLLTPIFAILTSVSCGNAQGFGDYGGGNPYSNGGSGNNNPYTGGGDFGPGSDFAGFHFSQASVALTAHAVLATLAFALFFPLGGILIRLASFRGSWLVHAIIQLFGYIMYIAAFALGIWMLRQRSVLIHDAHPIIGIVIFALLFFQPILGLLHHLFFKKYSKRVLWSYGHIWLGRILITLGIINGGLGLRYARRHPIAPPSTGTIIAYGVLAGLMWLVYVASIIIGERRRTRARAAKSVSYEKRHGGRRRRRA